MVFGILTTLTVTALTPARSDQSDGQLKKPFDRLRTTAVLWWLESSRSRFG
jgi:hypothetical protein